MNLSPNLLALYLGCEVFVPEQNKIGFLEGIDWHRDDNRETICVIIDVRYSDKRDDWTVLNENDEITRVKPVLRRLVSLTDEEIIEHYPDVKDIYGPFSDTGMSKLEVLRKYLTSPKGYGAIMYEKFSILDSVNDTTWLLSKSFDLFGLLENGLAIDSTTLKK